MQTDIGVLAGEHGAALEQAGAHFGALEASPRPPALLHAVRHQLEGDLRRTRNPDAARMTKWIAQIDLQCSHVPATIPIVNSPDERRQRDLPSRTVRAARGTLDPTLRLLMRAGYEPRCAGCCRVSIPSEKRQELQEKRHESETRRKSRHRDRR